MSASKKGDKTSSACSPTYKDISIPREQQRSSSPGISSGSDELTISSGGKAVCRLRFLYRPEYMKVGTLIVLREGRTIGIGTVLKIF